ncbi:MAG: D-alanine--D-alanine ligase, partial [Lachnospiraceae bacterium]|nr:D-alanine--D-alanine ligase [Lachnospiraceae bacterium]
GANGEDGRVQAMLDLCEIKYTGSNPLGAAVSMDKGISKQLFRESGIPTPGGILIRKGMQLKKEELPPFPLVVKACNSGSSVGVYIVNEEKDFDKALQDAFGFDDSVVIEQYIKGREFSVGVIEGKALPIIEIAPLSGFYDYKNKYQAGSTIETCPAELSEEKTKQIQHFAQLAFDALHIDSYARMDVMMDQDENAYLLEANTLPGMTPTSLLPQEAAAIGVDFPSLCQWLIEVSLRKWEDKEA